MYIYASIEIDTHTRTYTYLLRYAAPRVQASAGLAEACVPESRCYDHLPKTITIMNVLVITP